MLVFGVVAAIVEQPPLSGVVQVGEAGVVELQVAAAQAGDAADLFGVGGTEVGPELLLVGVDLRVDGRTAAPVVDHAGRRDGQLGGDAVIHPVRQEGEIVAENRLGEPDRGVDRQRRRLEIELALIVAEVHLDLLIGGTNAP